MAASWNDFSYYMFNPDTGEMLQTVVSTNNSRPMQIEATHIPHQFVTVESEGLMVLDMKHATLKKLGPLKNAKKSNQRMVFDMRKR